MATLPTNVDTTPNYTAAEHATHHNALHAVNNMVDSANLVLDDTLSTLTISTNAFGSATIEQDDGSGTVELNLVCNNGGSGRVEVWGADEVQLRTDNGGEITIENGIGIYVYANSGTALHLQGDSGSAELLLNAAGTQHNNSPLGFYGTTPIAKPSTVTARTALQNLGLGSSLTFEGILLSLIDAAGDLIVGTANDTAGRLAMGSALQVLRVNSGGTALEYATPSAGGADTTFYDVGMVR